MHLKKKIEKAIQPFLEMNNIEINKEDWIKINKHEHVLNLYEATVNIDYKNPDSIGVSFNVTCMRENVFHLTNCLSSIENVELFLIESFIFDENGNFLTGKDAFRLKEENELNSAFFVVETMNKQMKYATIN